MGYSYDSLDDSTEPIGWVSAFLARPGNDILCEVPDLWIDDPFNLTDLERVVPFFSQARDLILDITTSADDRVKDAAVLLYASIHWRYVRSAQGLETVRRKFRHGDFGKCPRILCEHQRLLPQALSPVPGKKAVGFYCPKCQRVYNAPDPCYLGVDGVFYGNDFAHYFMMTFPELFEGNQQ